jgi:hypothetical protein
MILDPTSPIGMVRLRVADYSDLPLFPDSVYQAVLDENTGSVTATAKTMANYILGALSHKTHRKLAQIEVWGAEAFKNYKDFLILTVKDPAFMSYSPIPYGASDDNSNPLVQFTQDWNKNYYSGTADQELAVSALYSPNDGSTYGRGYVE